MTLSKRGPATVRERERSRWPFSCRPRSRAGRPPTGASRRADLDPPGDLTALDTFDGEAMRAPADTHQDRTPTVAAAARRYGGSHQPGPLPPLAHRFEVCPDPAELRLLVHDGQDTLGYELRFRTGRGKDGGIGWSELSFHPVDGSVVETAVRASEAIALAREAGFGEQPARMTESVAAWIETAGCHQARRTASRLRREVQSGRARERIALHRVRLALLERLAAGEELVVMCERGGFTYRDGRPDTSWLLRRAGLVASVCSKTGKVRPPVPRATTRSARSSPRPTARRTNSGSER